MPVLLLPFQSVYLVAVFHVLLPQLGSQDNVKEMHGEGRLTWSLILRNVSAAPLRTTFVLVLVDNLDQFKEVSFYSKFARTFLS